MGDNWRHKLRREAGECDRKAALYLRKFERWHRTGDLNSWSAYESFATSLRWAAAGPRFVIEDGPARVVVVKK